MYYFGTNLDNRFVVHGFWPTAEQGHKFPREAEEIKAELEKAEDGPPGMEGAEASEKSSRDEGAERRRAGKKRKWGRIMTGGRAGQPLVATTLKLK